VVFVHWVLDWVFLIPGLDWDFGGDGHCMNSSISLSTEQARRNGDYNTLLP
jgi:hypothetical protein